VLVEAGTARAAKLLVDVGALPVSASSDPEVLPGSHEKRKRRGSHLRGLAHRPAQRYPCCPTELFGRSLRDYACGDLIGEDSSGTGRVAKPISGPPLIDSVRLRERILARGPTGASAVGAGRHGRRRRVLSVSSDFEPRPRDRSDASASCFFDTSSSLGGANSCFAWLGVPPTFAGYVRVSGASVPDTPAGLLWLERERLSDTISCRSVKTSTSCAGFSWSRARQQPSKQRRGIRPRLGGCIGQSGNGRTATQVRAENPEANPSSAIEQLAIVTHCRETGHPQPTSFGVDVWALVECLRSPRDWSPRSRTPTRSSSGSSSNSATKRLSEHLKPSVLGIADNRRSTRLPPISSRATPAALVESGRTSALRRRPMTPRPDAARSTATRPWRANCPNARVEQPSL